MAPTSIRWAGEVAPFSHTAGPTYDLEEQALQLDNRKAEAPEWLRQA
ncbi:hypothetical protein [Bacillus sp. PK3_68]|nr:hypothetical protein [Bacillus sp. PK3_68]